MKYKIFIIFILAGLFIPLLALVSCNPKPEKLGGGGGKFPTNTPDPRKQDPPPKPGGGATDPNGEVIDPGSGAGNHPGGRATDPGSGAGNHPGGRATDPVGGATDPVGGATDPVGGATDPVGGTTTGPSGGATDPVGGATDPVGGTTTGPSGGATDPVGGATDPVGGAAAGNSGSGAANQQDEALKQNIINYLISSLIHQGIKDPLNTHNNATWNEGKQDYIISGATQFFGAIQYTDAQKQPKLYNTQDDESKTARREMYLGFDYFPPYIEAFGKLANKMVATQNVQMKTELTKMVDKIRQYARAFYFTAFNTLIKKQDKLMKLDLNDIKTLRTKLQSIRSASGYIDSKFIFPIEKDYRHNIEVGTAKHQLKTTATAEEIQKYLKDKFTPIESDFDNAINTANEIAGILNKIQ
ncbi:hypothetical protein bhYOR_001086 (plasmid) [Borrelia nietonii YOR]|uniref:virulence associated lipoprotein n=1 Tax=Borrelia nietonii TaxID=3117462 RepID=UPI001FF62825|nr:virulence associated lipoprotein [Borrelia nietonii]UPA09780.1 hypothetical protein bhYOR_001086 [Borrelia nietonii YOR]